MCFSALASFSIAAGTGLVGALTVPKVSHWREVPLASIPLIFAAQQTIEGALWMLLPAGTETALIDSLANIFAVSALVVWPLWSPLAVGLVEQNRARRLTMTMLFFLALPVALLGITDISAHAYEVCISQNSLSYTNGTHYSPIELAAYIACVCCPLLLSSHKILRAFGMIVVTGLAISGSLYYATSFSVWCFFAAAGSGTIYLYFTVPSRDVAQSRLA